MNFGQLLTAMVTPFDQEGKVDFQATNSLINYLIATGTEGIVVAGTTGESPTLTTEEKTELFKYVVEVVDGRVPVIAGTGSNNTVASIELTKIASSVGVNGIMLVVPYYNKPSQEGLYQHFKTIAESTELPVMLYNIPGRSAVNMLPETIIRLAQIDNIVCIKEASGDLEAIANIIQHTPEDFLVYTGDDSLTLPLMSIGGYGVVSVASHVVGLEMKQMITAFQNGEYKQAAQMHRNLLPIMKSMFIAPNPTPVKAALGMLGQNVGSVRLPLVPLTLEESQIVHSALEPKILSSAV
ncbi:4-hydroxy-tetrahydrodipicolinate synthase [Anaerobacillus alkalidiazotrophicus]|uniref:4-hydroxy-tetrahydrodipicolinate synthase n=1 Tax=Anaerobacillus alkalidiazotrophicus TaxID=472963 RepID=A0A1S2M3C0_9BACI|nr:4-hydroxy-tetrahydrodipicolinate synthase [Anaerobacillus alkalidiazotrophicus]OIJ19249.1 4-hydroxy-tetrahydrodipicolinate synthase [Anaerobacillus alkalidiazotrophicus]